MSITDSSEKINPVRNCEGTQQPSISNGVKQFVESEKGKDILVVIIVILIGLGSFELGRLSKNSTSSGIKIEYPDEKSTSQTYQEASVISGTNNSNITLLKNLDDNTSIKNFFASKRGHKYYTLGCSAGKSIKAENRVYFDTRENAEKAGYILSTSCN